MNRLTSLLIAGLGLLALSLPAISQASQTAVLSISPGSGTVNVGDKLTVNVLLDTGGNTTNGITVYLNYSNNLQFSSFDASDSVFTTAVTDPNPGPTDTTLHFTKLIISSGYNGSAGQVMRLVFNAVSAGTPTITIDQTNSQVGTFTETNILNSVTNGSYTVSAAPAAATPTPAPAATATPIATAAPAATPTPAPAAATAKAVASATPRPATLPATGDSPANILALITASALAIGLVAIAGRKLNNGR